MAEYAAKEKGKRDEKLEHMEQIIKDIMNHYDKTPELMAEVFQFGAKFYKYSMKNTLLIQGQNPYAQYVQSFQSWKEMGASVKKGEHGMSIFVPVKVTCLKMTDPVTKEEKKIPLRSASKELKEAYKAGKVEGFESIYFKIGTVFDISQTTYPKEKYPELFFMGYSSEQSRQVLTGLRNFCEEELNCPVKDVDLSSIALRGLYFPMFHKIELNELMEDTARLSTLAHEMGHALIHNKEMGGEKSPYRKEFEADAISIMVSTHFEEQISEARKVHLTEHYKMLKVKEPDIEIDQCISYVFNVYKDNIEEMDKYVKKEIERTQHLQKETDMAMCMKEYSEKKPKSKGIEMDRGW